LKLDEYEKEEEQRNFGISKTKNFRYPPVLPIVFYDGSSPWTSETNFLNRTYLNEVFAKYIPTFEYELVDLRRYKSEEIMRFNDTLSMVMLLDRLGISGGRDYSETVLNEYVEKMSLQVPENLIRLIKDVITVLMTHQGRGKEEIAEVVEHIEGRRFSDMFEAYMENVQMLTERTHELEHDKQELEQTLLEKDQRLEESERQREAEKRLREESERQREAERLKLEELERKLREYEKRNQ
jgi:hypothetical protein